MSEVKYEASGYQVTPWGQVLWFVDREVERDDVGVIIERRSQDTDQFMGRFYMNASKVDGELARPARSFRHVAGTRRAKLKNARAWDPATGSFSKLPKV